MMMMKNILWGLAIMLLVSTGIAVAQDPSVFFQPIEIHRGFLLLGKDIYIRYDGATAGGPFTILTVTDPTDFRTITLPDESGTLLMKESVKLPPVLCANLGTPDDGVLINCSDCIIANPCECGGGGALAKRFGGAWICN